tara:strand:- start:210 stop:437 length:228 start_codon:yes stop_codon:yes gene_type:complete
MEEKIKEIMAESFQISPLEINHETTSINLQSWDSLGHLNMIIAMEKGFNIDINDDEAIKMITYPMILEVISEKIN